MKPNLLDLFCGAGRAGWGYRLAGFGVVGQRVQGHLDLSSNEELEHEPGFTK